MIPSCSISDSLVIPKWLELPTPRQAWPKNPRRKKTTCYSRQADVYTKWTKTSTSGMMSSTLPSTGKCLWSLVSSSFTIVSRSQYLVRGIVVLVLCDESCYGNEIKYCLISRSLHFVMVMLIMLVMMTMLPHYPWKWKAVAMVEVVRMRAYKNLITVEFKYFDLGPCHPSCVPLTAVVYLCSAS